MSTTKRKSYSNYRPICDTWILARAKLKEGAKYYGAYLGGFPERARVLLGVTMEDPVLHVCGGKSKMYPYANAIGPNDKTIDLDASLRPDIVRDVRETLPLMDDPACIQDGNIRALKFWPAILADPPYSEADAEHYLVGRDAYPSPMKLVANCIDAVRIGGRVGFLHYVWPAPPKNARSVAIVSVYCGFNNRVRAFSVFERME